MGVRGFSFLESLQWEKVGVMDRKEGTERPGCRRDSGILAGDVDGGQVNHSQRFGLYARTVSGVGVMDVILREGDGVRCVFWEACPPLIGRLDGRGYARRLRGQ